MYLEEALKNLLHPLIYNQMFQSIRQVNMRFLTLIFLMCSLQVFGAEAVKDDLKKDKKETPKIEFDESKLEKNIATKPSFSRSSEDQAKIDVVLEKKQNEFDDLAFKHIEELDACSGLKTIPEIQNCKKEYLKIKKKK